MQVANDFFYFLGIHISLKLKKGIHISCTYIVWPVKAASMITTRNVSDVLSSPRERYI